MACRAWLRRFAGILALAASALAMPSDARAQSDTCETIFLDLVRQTGDDVRRIQGGPRSFYSPAEARGRFDMASLRDGYFGTQTLRGIEALCRDVPVATDTLSKREAVLKAARHYNDLAFDEDGRPTAGRWPNWTSIVAQSDFANALAHGRRDDGHNLRQLRFAGTPPMVVRLFDELENGAPPLDGSRACRDLDAVVDRATAERALPPELVQDVLDQLLGHPLGTAASNPGGAVAALCRNLPLAGPPAQRADAVLDAIEHFALIEGGEADGIEILTSPRFAAWAREPDVGDLEAHRLRRLAGSAEAVLALIREFEDDAGLLPIPAIAEPAACRALPGWHYWELQQADIDALAQRAKRAAALTAQRDAAFGSRPDLVTAILGEDPDVDACSRALAAAYAGATPVSVRWRLAPDARASLLAALPNGGEGLAAALDVPPAASAAQAAERIQDALVDRLTNLRLATLTQLVDFVMNQAVPAPPLETRQSGGEAGTDATAAPVDATPGGDAQASDAAAEASSQPNPETTDPAPRDAATPAAPATSAAEEFILPAEARDVLIGNGVPAAAVDSVLETPLLETELRAAAYTAISDALVARDRAFATAAFRERIEAGLERETTLTLTDPLIDRLLAELPIFQTVPQALLSEVAPVVDVAFPEAPLFQAAARHPTNPATVTDDIAAPGGPSPATADDYTTLTIAARQTPAGPGQSFTEAVGDCGCQRTLESKVYGFYPFWTADAPVEGTRLDLSRMSDVAFVGARLSGRDEVRVEATAWREPGVAVDFVRTAHRHLVDGDLAVQLADWQAWSPESIEAAATAIASLADVAPTEASSGRRWLRGTAGGTLRGVTLHFTGFGNVAEAELGERIQQIVDVVRAVQTTPLPSINQALQSRLHINIALAMPGIGEAVADREKLIERAFLGLRDVLDVEGDFLDRDAEGDTAKGDVRYVLVFIDRPTRASKKTLHVGIQDAYSGDARRAVLRQTVAVIPPTGHEAVYHLVPQLDGDEVVLRTQPTPFSQLRDDLTFFKDNFAGVGFWPPPLADQPNYADVRDAIDETLRPERIDDLLTWAAEMAPFAICDVVCPNRGLFRLLLAGLLASWLTVAIVARLWCRFCTEIADRFFLPLGLFVLMVASFLVVSVCDPELRKLSFFVLIGALFLAVAYAAANRVARVGGEDEP